MNIKGEKRFPVWVLEVRDGVQRMKDPVTSSQTTHVRCLVIKPPDSWYAFRSYIKVSRNNINLVPGLS